jgi:hypothetical protein
VELANSLFSTGSEKAIIAATAMAIFLPLTGLADLADGLMLLWSFLLLLLMFSLDTPKYARHAPTVVGLCVLLLTAGLTTALAWTVHVKCILIFLIALVGAGIKIFHVRDEHQIMRAADEAAAAVSSFLELMDKPSKEDKPRLMQILVIDPPRNDALLIEFRRGMEGKSVEAQQTFLNKFYIKYEGVLLTDVPTRYR